MALLTLCASALLLLSAQEPWRPVHQSLEHECRRMGESLQAAKEEILRRSPEWHDRLERVETKTLPRGWGRLPTVIEDAPDRALEPRERKYALAELGDWFAPDVAKAAKLVESLPAGDGPVPEASVAKLEKLQKRFRLFDEHLSYHSKWQAAVVEDAKFFRGRNELLALAREWRERREEPGSEERLRELSDRLHRFGRIDGLVVHGMGTHWSLPITIQTDITDTEFLAAFEDAVRRYWSGATSSVDVPLELRLEFRVIEAAELYDGEPPKLGDPIDTSAHIDRFPEGFVLTTGAKSIFAKVGRAIVLGPAPVTPRTLAHEFGHLLGFTDAYLRAYEGDPDSEFGATLVEVYGMFDDLMGNSKGGRVSPAMVDELVEAYLE